MTVLRETPGDAGHVSLHIFQFSHCTDWTLCFLINCYIHEKIKRQYANTEFILIQNIQQICKQTRFKIVDAHVYMMTENKITGMYFVRIPHESSIKCTAVTDHNTYAHIWTEENYIYDQSNQ